jgi:hypothetical protein
MKVVTSPHDVVQPKKPFDECVSFSAAPVRRSSARRTRCRRFGVNTARKAGGDEEGRKHEHANR